MNWGDFKTYTKQKLNPAGDSIIDLSTITLASAFDTRLQILVRMFTADAYILYTPKVAFTPPTNDIVFATSGIASCSIFEAKTVWIDSGKIGKYDSIAALERDFDTVNTVTAKPRAWAMQSEGVIQFNCIPDSAYSNSFIAGWYSHPPFTNDNDTVRISERQIDVAAVYCARLFMEPVIFRDESLTRLKRYDVTAFEAVRRIKAENLKRHFDLTQRGG